MWVCSREAIRYGRSGDRERDCRFLFFPLERRRFDYIFLESSSLRHVICYNLVTDRKRNPKRKIEISRWSSGTFFCSKIEKISILHQGFRMPAWVPYRTIIIGLAQSVVVSGQNTFVWPTVCDRNRCIDVCNTTWDIGERTKSWVYRMMIFSRYRP